MTATMRCIIWPVLDVAEPNSLHPQSIAKLLVRTAVTDTAEQTAELRCSNATLSQLQSP